MLWYPASSHKPCRWNSDTTCTGNLHIGPEPPERCATVSLACSMRTSVPNHQCVECPQLVCTLTSHHSWLRCCGCHVTCSWALMMPHALAHRATYVASLSWLCMMHSGMVLMYFMCSPVPQAGIGMLRGSVLAWQLPVAGWHQLSLHRVYHASFSALAGSWVAASPSQPVSPGDCVCV
jgi:hypothetical protein